MCCQTAGSIPAHLIETGEEMFVKGEQVVLRCTLYCGKDRYGPLVVKEGEVGVILHKSGYDSDAWVIQFPNITMQVREDNLYSSKDFVKR